MLGVVGNLLHRLIRDRQITAEKPFGVNHRALLTQFVPDRKRIFGPARIGMVEIVHPVDHRRRGAPFVTGCRRGRIVQQRVAHGPYSPVMSIANSGQLVWASQALSSRPFGTVPSPTSWALPYSSRLKSSGASDLQRAWP